MQYAEDYSSSVYISLRETAVLNVLWSCAEGTAVYVAVVELVYTRDLNSRAVRIEGSSPSGDTICWHSSVGRVPVLYSGCHGFDSCCQLQLAGMAEWQTRQIQTLLSQTCGFKSRARHHGPPAKERGIKI